MLGIYIFIQDEAYDSEDSLLLTILEEDRKSLGESQQLYEKPIRCRESGKFCTITNLSLQVTYDP